MHIQVRQTGSCSAGTPALASAAASTIPYQRLFLDAGQALDCPLPAQRLGTVQTKFAVTHDHRSASARVARCAPGVVLANSPREIIGNAGIERTIAAFDYVHMPSRYAPGAVIVASWVFHPVLNRHGTLETQITIPAQRSRICTR